MKTLRRILSLFLAIILVLCCFPCTTFATGSGSGYYFTTSQSPATGNYSVADAPALCDTVSVNQSLYLVAAGSSNLRFSKIVFYVKQPDSSYYKRVYTETASNYLRYTSYNYTFQSAGEYYVRAAMYLKNGNGRYYSSERKVTVLDNSNGLTDYYPENGLYTIHASSDYGYCWDICGGSTQSQALLQLYNDNDTNAQIFSIKRLDNGYYTITNIASGLVINVVDNNQTYDGRLWQYQYDGTSACWWSFKKDGNGNIIIISSNGRFAVDLHDNVCQNTQLIHLWEIHDGPSCRWVLEPLEPVVYIQCQAKWKKCSYLPGYTMYGSGCGVFALCTAIHSVSGYNFTDDDIKYVAQVAIEKGHRSPNIGTDKKLATESELQEKYCYRLGEILYYNKYNNVYIKSQMISTVKNGGALYFSVKSSSGGHIMSIIGYRCIDGVDQLLIADSYPMDSRLGANVSYAWTTLDDELDFHIVGSGKKLTTKGSLGFYQILPNN